MILKWVLVSLARLFVEEELFCFCFNICLFLFYKGEIIWKKKRYVSNMDWTPAVDSMDDLKCQERVISFSMSTLKLDSNRHARGFFCSFYLEAHNLGTFPALQIKILLASSGCILISSCHLAWFFSHQKILSAEAPRAVVFWAMPAASEVLWCRCGANGIASKVAGWLVVTLRPGWGG